MWQKTEFGRTLKIGSNLLKLVANGLSLFMKADKPLCIQEDNKLVHLDLTRSQLPGSVPVMTGFKKLEFLSPDNTGIKELPSTFLQHYPALKVLKLNKLDIGNFIKNIDENFFWVMSNT